MQMWVLFAVGIASIVALGIGMVMFVLLQNVRMAQGPAMQGKYPQGHWMSVGMCIGIALGCIPSLAGILFDEMSSFVGISPAIGCGLGVALGAALERKHKDELRPLTEKEQQTRKWAMFIGLLLLVVLGVLALGGMLVLVLMR